MAWQKHIQASNGGARRVPPSPPGMPILGHIPAAMRDFLHMYLDAWRQHGDVVRFRMGPMSVYLLAHPDHVHHVLVQNRDNYYRGFGYDALKLMLGLGLLTSDGELWQQQRHLMQPVFVPRQLASLAEHMVQSCAEAAERWQPYADQQRVLDVSRAMMELTMTIITRTMFGVDLSDTASRTGPAFRTAFDYLYLRAMLPWSWPTSWPLPINRRFHQAMQTLDGVVYSVIEQRRRQEPERPDLLTMLLNARDQQTGQAMSQQQLRDEVMTIFFAGHETTANVLTWTWHMLSRHAAVERELHAELDRVLGGRPPTAQDLPNLKYTRMVVEESMRLYPPVYVMARNVRADDEIDGYHIPAGSLVALSPYVTHRYPAFWDNPEGFDPLRFSPERSEGRPRYAYFPFGGGPRICIGNHFALMEAQIILATLAQRYSLHLVPGHAARLRPRGTLQCEGGMPMTLHARQPRSAGGVPQAASCSSREPGRTNSQ